MNDILYNDTTAMFGASNEKMTVMNEDRDRRKMDAFTTLLRPLHS